MFRSPHGDDRDDLAGVVGETGASVQTTVPGPAAWPMPKASRTLRPLCTRPVTSPLVASARRPSRARSPGTVWPTAGPRPAVSVTVMLAPRWAVTSQDWVLEVVTERVAPANSP